MLWWRLTPVPLAGDTSEWSPAALKEWLLSPPICTSSEPVVDGACAGVDGVFCQDPRPSGKCTCDGHRAPQKYLTPVSGSALLSLDLPGSWDNANGFELTSVGKCRCWMKNWKCAQLFHLFYFIFVIYIVHTLEDTILDMYFYKPGNWWLSGICTVSFCCCRWLSFQPKVEWLPLPGLGFHFKRRSGGQTCPARVGEQPQNIGCIVPQALGPQSEPGWDLIFRIQRPEPWCWKEKALQRALLTAGPASKARMQHWFHLGWVVRESW